MKLRPHHILCLQKFTGHGYDEEFTRHMTSVVMSLAQSPEAEIEIIRGCDELCGNCPNNSGGACTSLEKVAEMDSGVLKICGLDYGNSTDWAELAQTARKRIFETEEFYNICARCQWFELCSGTEVNYG
ncbi:MAG: DUF1284 domain-containing protein [Oscillospiraceae bacterium]|nr:DUF1284 domain-containing protein [Oscillospiraceae bacterium]